MIFFSHDDNRNGPRDERSSQSAGIRVGSSDAQSRSDRAYAQETRDRARDLQQVRELLEKTAVVVSLGAIVSRNMTLGVAGLSIHVITREVAKAEQALRDQAAEADRKAAEAAEAERQAAEAERKAAEVERKAAEAERKAAESEKEKNRRDEARTRSELERGYGDRDLGFREGGYTGSDRFGGGDRMPA